METNYIEMAQGRFSQRLRSVPPASRSSCSARRPVEALFQNTDPIGKKIRIGGDEFTVVGVFGKRPSPIGGNPNEFAVIPITTYDKISAAPLPRA